MALEVEIELIKTSIRYSSHDLVKRAVRSAISHIAGPSERWVKGQPWFVDYGTWDLWEDNTE